MYQPSFRPLVLVAVAALGGACNTTVEVRPVKSGATRQGGIPFFSPSPHVHVKQALETGRSESLFAVIEVGGLERYYYELPLSTLAQAIQDLETMLQIGKLQPVPYTAPATALTEMHEIRTGSGTTDIEKFTLVPAAGTEVADSAPFYTASDVSKAVELVMLPDPKREWELMIDPALFASNEVDVTLTDGWQLAAIGTKTTNPVLTEVGDIISDVLGASKEVQLAKLANEQAVKLQQLMNKGPQDDDAKLAPDGADPEDVTLTSVRVVGYVKRVELAVVQPGVYPLSSLIGGQTLPTKTSSFWMRYAF